MHVQRIILYYYNKWLHNVHIVPWGRGSVGFASTCAENNINNNYYNKWLHNVHIVPWVGIVRISVVWLIFLPSIRIMPTLCLRLPTAIVIMRGPELSRSC